MIQKPTYIPPSVRIAAALIPENVMTASHEGFPVDPVDPDIFES
jgi:hypothetical protein